jgi:hypothetical protein
VRSAGTPLSMRSPGRFRRGEHGPHAPRRRGGGFGETSQCEVRKTVASRPVFYLN